MSEVSSDPDPLLPLAEEFAARYRRGERPTPAEYADKHPELAERIRRVFPTLVVMEEFGSVGGESTGPYGAVAGSAPARLGEYRILREVGRGGMGVVYEAVQESLGRHVALKVLQAHRFLSPMLLQRFEREAKAAARLHHTNIVPVYGVGEADGVHFYAMQFIQGQSVDGVLRELRRQRGGAAGDSADEPTRKTADAANAVPNPSVADRLQSASFSGGPAPGVGSASAAPSGGGPSPTTSSSELSGRSEAEYFHSVARIGVEAAEALAHAHAQGVLHRDIKPGNLLLDTQGTVWVTDFGLAKLEGSDDLTSDGEVPGTLRYVAPERFAGPADARSDLYSLGLTLYELLTLRPAFDGATRAELIERILHAEPARPRSLARQLPRDLEAVILKAVAREPAERYQTAQELADDLRRFLEDLPVYARRSTPVQRLRKWVRRHQAVVATAAAGLIVAVAVAAGGAGWVLRDQSAQRSRSGDEAGQAVQELETLRGERRWPEAIEVARRAERLLTSGRGDPDQLRRVRELLRDVQMAQDLEEIRGQAGDAFEFAPVDRDFAVAFQRFGIDVEELDPAEAAERIRARSVSVELAAAVDYWALKLRERAREVDAEKWQRLVQVARLADPDERRQQVRDALLKRDEKTLKQLAADPKTLELPTSTLDLLGIGLDAVGSPGAAANFLRAAQLRHPNDFWINHRLAWCLMGIPRRGEAVRFYTVAVGLRPRSPAAWANLGSILYQNGATDDAAAALHEALRLNPDHVVANNNMGNVLARKGDFDGAIAAYKKAAALGPKSVEPHVNLGKDLINKGDFDGAVVECEKAIRLEPRSIEARGNLGRALAHKGAHEKAAAAHREAIALAEERARSTPRYRFQVAWELNNLASAYPEETRPEIEKALRRALTIAHQLEKEDRQSVEYRELLGKTYNNLGLLLRRRGQHAEAEKALREAVRYQELVVESDPTPERRFWLAGSYVSLEILLSAEGRLPEAEKVSEQAAELLRELVKDCPDVAEFNKLLAMSHFNRGLLFEIARPADAEKELQEAVKLFRELVKGHSGAPEYRAYLGTSYTSLGRLLIRGGGRAEAAENALREAQKLLEPLAKDFKGVALYRKLLAVNYSNLATLLEQDPGRAAEAETFANKSLELHEGLARDDPTIPEYKSRLALSLHNRALDLKKRNEFAEARKVMERAVDLQRAALDATGGRERRYRELLRDHYWGLTEIHLGAGDHATAAETAENLPRLFPDGWEEYFRAGSMLARCAVAARQDARLSPEERKQRDSAYKSRVNELCATAAKRIAAADPKTAEARLDLAQGAVKIGTYFALEHEWALAKQNFDKAIELQPTLAEAYFALGDMLYHQHQWAEAAAAFSKAVALRHDYAEAYDGLAKALDSQGKTKEKDAVAAYRAAGKLYTDKAAAARVQVNLGNCLARNGHLHEAEIEFGRAVELQPKLAEAHYSLGRVLCEQNKTREAIPSLRKAVDIKTDYAAAHEYLAMALEDHGETEAAIAAYRDAGKYFTNKADTARVQLNLGTCLAKRGRLLEAEKEFRRAIELEPKLDGAHFNLGLALAQQDKTQEALPSFRAAVELKSDNAQYWAVLGLTLQKEGDIADALKALEKSRNLLRPDDPNRRTMQLSVDRCNQLIELDRKLAEILKGAAKPEGAAERVELAQVCVAKKLYGAAARFYQEAFADEPRMAEDLRAGRRYEAARAASRAGGGQGKDDPAPDEEARARWRKQALDWLKADLALWGRLVQDGQPAARDAAGQKLAQWQGDLALAGLRGDAIAKLPDAEREAWQKFWADVGELLMKVKPKAKETPPDKP
jgi:tetratricopeptide (TPR) repeat protein